MDCQACGFSNPPGFRFCGSCGAPLVAASEVEGERRRVTVLFADLVGYSTLAERLDPEELRALVASTFAELADEVRARDGTVEKFVGDAIVAVFGAPVAHEDDPARTVDTAVAMAAAAERRAAASSSPLELRIGVNTGLVVSGPVGDGSQTGVMGDAVNVAARLQQRAGPGEILVSASTWRQVRSRYAGEALGTLAVKGKQTPVDAYCILGPRSAAIRPATPFVGRTEELALVELLWSSARKGNTHVVSVVGEPGVGKSRLLAELPRREDALDVRIVCTGERAFGPFLELLGAILGGVPATPGELDARVAKLDLGEEISRPLAALLGLGDAPPAAMMADEQRAKQVFAAFWRLLAAACRDRPALVALDDVHWADDSSLGLLEFLLEQLAGVPLLLVLLARPGFRTHGSVELRASHTGIRLEPLEPGQSVALARGLLGVESLPRDLERVVAERAEGNPFFIEELLHALVELGSLVVADGRAELDAARLDIPDTVQGTILARLDRLEPPVRDVLQRAAVLGRAFPDDHLRAVAGDDVDRPLAVLVRSQLLVQPDPGSWAFKHALIQEVAYDTLLLRRRRELHRKTAEALEGLAGDDPATLETLAAHFARAEAAEQARRYAVAAGDLARERAGFVEARRRYETALSLWGEGDEAGRRDLLMRLGYAANLAGDTGRARAAFVEAEESARAAGDLRTAGAALAMLGRVNWIGGDAARASQSLDAAIALLEAHGPSAELAEAYVWASTLRMLVGDTHEALELSRAGLAIAAELGHDAFRAHLLNTLGVCEMELGDPAGLDRIGEALELALATGDGEALGRAYVNRTDSLIRHGYLRRGLVVSERGRDEMRRRGAPTFQWFIVGNGAIALCWLGRYEDALASTAEALEHRDELGGPGIVSLGQARALTLLRLGRYDEARTIVDEVLPLSRSLGGWQYLGDTLAIEAELEAARGNEGVARRSAEESLAITTRVVSGQARAAILPMVARLVGGEVAHRLAEETRAQIAYPLLDAVLAEADGVLARDPARSLEAAARYEELEMPYEQASCLLDAGERERARAIVERLGLANGPLGQRLRG